MEGGSPELKTSLWVQAGWPSLEARVTSMKSAVHDERGSVFFCRNSAPPSISSYWRRALPLHSFGGWVQALPGVQGKRKGGANGERESEGLLMAGQRIAEIHALGGQRKAIFLEISESRK